ncbi:hypothetical protein C8J57DRAFT_1286459 [Mycena rebaudengoi]|nr:hypothetical protein C8J57DRAFT_1286459 [Mycena rebaudengoi]
MKVLSPLLLLGASVASMDAQSPFAAHPKWKVELSAVWNVLGPFPIHAREQQFLSPSFPLNLSEPINFTQTWPSSYADNGRVGWAQTHATPEGDLKVSFPNIRWSALRATEGWAAIQHHALLHTSITLYPPEDAAASPPPRLLVELIQGSYIAILPALGSSEPHSAPEWNAGNIYDMQRTLPRAIELPSPASTIEPTTYEVFVSGDYEIRLFGDPRENTPVQSLRLMIDVELPTHSFVLESTQDVLCDFVDGYAFGDAIGLGVRSVSGWWTVTRASLTTEAQGFTVELLRPTIIAPSQTRVVPIRIVQVERYLQPTLTIDLTLTSDADEKPTTISVALPIKHLPRWAPDTLLAIQGSYFYAQEMPTIFSTFPPLLENIGAPQPPILCLHGAGVDVISESFWIDSLPPQQHNWVVAPTGRTPWGLDWHGPSAKDAWGSIDALVSILDANPAWYPRKLSPNLPVVLMGHSNGGQGAWYLASRYPDRVLGVVPAAAYIKSQAYVPLIMSRSAHFIDPFHRAILESSLTPDDNDLFLSNLVDTPVLAIHGGNDNNVPVWHSREAVSVLQAWNADVNVTFREDAGQLHWYPSVLKNDQVQSFLDALLRQPSSQHKPRSKTFTLTVAVPFESGSLHGWKIEALEVPGRLGRLTVEALPDNKIRVVTSNVIRFSVLSDMWELNSLYIDKSAMEVPPEYHGVGAITFERDETKTWNIGAEKTAIQKSARIQSFLSTAAPFVIAVADGTNSHHMSLALRIAYDLNAYHRLDAEIVVSAESLQERLDSPGNILIIGDTASPFVHKLLKRAETPFRVDGENLTLRNTILDEAGLGILFLHPHPTNPEGQVLFLLSTDSHGLERAGRLFPIRTGVSVPDWVITSSRADQKGAGGVVGAGVWGAGWSWNVMSWLY